MSNKIYLAIIVVLAIALFVLIGRQQQPTETTMSMAYKTVDSGPIPVLLVNDVVQSVGINFESKEPIVVDALTGKILDSCGPVEGEPKDQIKRVKRLTSTDSTCKTKLVKQPDGGYILFDKETGKRIDLTIVKAVIALWKGSSCNTTAVGGNQYESCQTKEKKCKALKAMGIRAPGC